MATHSPSLGPTQARIEKGKQHVNRTVFERLDRSSWKHKLLMPRAQGTMFVQFQCVLCRLKK